MFLARIIWSAQKARLAADSHQIWLRLVVRRQTNRRRLTSFLWKVHALIRPLVQPQHVILSGHDSLTLAIIKKCCVTLIWGTTAFLWAAILCLRIIVRLSDLVWLNSRTCEQRNSCTGKIHRIVLWSGRKAVEVVHSIWHARLLAAVVWIMSWRGDPWYRDYT
jgi:hypothetical protein